MTDHLHDADAPRAHAAGEFLTVLTVGVLGLVALQMSHNGQLGYLLASPFHPLVTASGWALLGLAAVRAVAIRHDGGGHHHNSDWTYTRLAVLCLPVALFLCGVPYSGFSQARIQKLLGGDDAVTGFLSPPYTDGTVTAFNELAAGASDEAERERLRGRTAVVSGRVSRIDDRQFTVYRLKMTCCAADVVPAKVRVVLERGTLGGFGEGDWFEATGRVQYVPAPNSKHFIPVVLVADAAGFRRVAPAGEYD
ncbi:hypothetical protein [Urbifossiella limnaea]|uniref:TIGR03943 family protein n=1 Tax=Urbifossiella limnaea TaxID=2528023 RepID=A0A517XPW7_9BACT|nr:hypothetical protein [Urbifossiella limnaea]QDU19536.1 hypothetical protein ETAA1_14650 [Urbifossiella limnaea]